MDRKKRLGITTVALSTMVLMASPVHAATTAAMGMSAVILASVLAVFEITPLDFGSLLEVGAGTVAIDAKDTHTVSANITEIAAGHAGKIGITALSGVPVKIDYPDTGTANAITITETGPGTDTMKVSSIVIGKTTVAGVASKLTATLTGTPATITGTFGVGGTLNVNAGQTPGTYTGSVTITVVY